MLPGSHVLLVLGLDRSDVIRGAESDRVPASRFLGGGREVVIGDILGDGIPLGLESATGILLESYDHHHQHHHRKNSVSKI